MQVYFAAIDGKIKIGISKNAIARVVQINRSHATPLSLIGAVEGDHELERTMHKRLAAYRISGEWFRDCAEVRAAIQVCLNNFEQAKQFPQDKKAHRGFCPFGLALRGIWGNDAAIELAARSGKKLRVCEYKIKGTVKTTGVDIAVLVDAVTKRR